MPALKLVHASTVSFRKSEATNLNELMKRHHIVLRTNEAAAFVSVRGDQILMARVKSIAFSGGKMRKVYHSQRFRVSGDVWTPEFLFKSAQEFGVDLNWVRRQILDYFAERNVELARAA